MRPKATLVVAAYNMARELPRTVRSLSPAMQAGVGAGDYEIIVVDNGSTQPFDEAACRAWGADLTIQRVPREQASVSPCAAINAGIAAARGELIGVLVDGARMTSPGLVKTALKASRLSERAVILTLSFHLGPKVQMESLREGYGQAVEDQLLEDAAWTEDGYRLFDISVFAGNSAGGWFRPMRESNAVFMRRALWQELGGLDERFVTPGGGFVNLDLLTRAVALPDAEVVTLLGEGTFHQVHGGVAANAVDHDPVPRFLQEYAAIRGQPYRDPAYESLYVGELQRSSIFRSIERSAADRAEAN
jgi:glycosyltransferase involved in cell wall biosynthesis